MNRTSTLRDFRLFIMPYLWPHRRVLLLTLSAAVVSLLLICIEPLLQRNFINALTGHNERGAWIAVLVVAGCIGLRRLLRGWGARSCSRIGARVTGAVESSLIRRLFTLPLEALRGFGPGYLTGRINSDCESMQFLYSNGMLGIVESVLRLVGGVAFLLWIDWRVGVTALAVLPFYAWLSLAFRRRQYRLGSRFSETVAKSSRQLHSSLGGAAMVKACAAEEQLSASLSDRFRQLAELKVLRSDLRVRFNLLLQIVPGVAQAVLICFGIRMILDGTWTLGELWALNRYLDFVFAPARELAGGMLQMQFALAAADRVERLTRLAPESRLDDGLVPDRLAGEIEFRGVDFGYPERGTLFRNVSFQLRPGETVALFGASGCGKTSLVNLLLRLYTPERGEIRIDGVPIGEYNLRALRRRIGYIGQNSEFLRGTLAENLSWGRENISRHEQCAVLARVGLDATLNPDCEVLESASNFSGGERLRLALARELLRDSDIVILDEATANLDVENERMIFRMIRREFQSRTVILISHQSRVLEYADRTITIDWGDKHA